MITDIIKKLLWAGAIGVSVLNMNLVLADVSGETSVGDIGTSAYYNGQTNFASNNVDPYYYCDYYQIPNSFNSTCYYPPEDNYYPYYLYYPESLLVPLSYDAWEGEQEYNTTNIYYTNPSPYYTHTSVSPYYWPAYYHPYYYNRAYTPYERYDHYVNTQGYPYESDRLYNQTHPYNTNGYNSTHSTNTTNNLGSSNQHVPNQHATTHPNQNVNSHNTMPYSSHHYPSTSQPTNMTEKHYNAPYSHESFQSSHINTPAPMMVHGGQMFQMPSGAGFNNFHNSGGWSGGGNSFHGESFGSEFHGGGSSFHGGSVGGGFHGGGGGRK